MAVQSRGRDGMNGRLCGDGECVDYAYKYVAIALRGMLEQDILVLCW